MKLMYGLTFSLLFALSLSAQTPQLEKGNLTFDVNTHTWGNQGASPTIMFTKLEEVTLWNIGAKLGYFVIDGLAIKGGFGLGRPYISYGIRSTYGLGLRYYLAKVIPIEVEYISFSSIRSGAFGFPEIQGWKQVGIQAGYAFFLGEKVSIEPTIRYNTNLSEQVESALTGHIGLSILMN